MARKYEGDITYIAMELENPLLAHLRGPDGGGEDEGVGRSCYLRIRAELLRLSSRLPACASDNEDMLEAVLVQSVSCESDGGLALLGR